MSERKTVYIGVTAFKRHLERCLREAAEEGSDIVIMRRNAPLAWVVPLAPSDGGGKGESEKRGCKGRVM